MRKGEKGDQEAAGAEGACWVWGWVRGGGVGEVKFEGWPEGGVVTVVAVVVVVVDGVGVSTYLDRGGRAVMAHWMGLEWVGCTVWEVCGNRLAL